VRRMRCSFVESPGGHVQGLTWSGVLENGIRVSSYPTSVGCVRVRGLDQP
jgi:hypothetical protein